jgi:hypothetical protein
MRTAIGLAMVGLLGVAVGAPADEVKVPLNAVPKGVLQTVQKRFPKAELIEASKETEDGKTVYEVSLKNAGQKIDATLSATGTLLTLEKQIAAKSLPKAVTAALSAKYPKATHKLAEEVIHIKGGKESLAYYEVLLATGKKLVEVEVTAAGKIQKTEEKKGGDKD